MKALCMNFKFFGGEMNLSYNSVFLCKLLTISLQPPLLQVRCSAFKWLQRYLDVFTKLFYRNYSMEFFQYLVWVCHEKGKSC